MQFSFFLCLIREIQKPFCRSGSDPLVNKQEKGRMRVLEANQLPDVWFAEF